MKRTFALGHGCKNEYHLLMKLVYQLLLLYLLGPGSAYAQQLNPKLVQTTTGCNTYTLQNFENITVEFSGACINGLISGNGIRKIYQKNNLLQTIDGEFKDGWPNGQATSTDAKGNKYVGEFKDGKPIRQGTVTSASGDKFVGEWKDNKFNGQGTNILPSGDKYVGEFKDSKRNGQGTLTFANGNKYVGEFKDDKFNGQGTEYAGNGSIIREGIWANSMLISPTPVHSDRYPLRSDHARQQATVPNQEVERLRAEASEAKRKQAEAEQKMRVAEQQASQTRENDRLRVEAEEAKRKQAEAELRLAQLQAPQTSQSTTLSSSLPTMANRRALVIGNDSYKSVTKLLNAREDAKAIASNLTAVGYKVTLQLDLNEKEMKAALRTFSSQVQGGDEVMFFFAGHGVQLGAANYLLPTDIGGESEAQVKDEAIQLQRVLDDMTEKKAKFTLAMIDACRDNPFKSTGRNIGGRGLAPTTAATGQMVVFSAGTGQQALDRLGNNDKNKNGVFTRTFLKEMQKPGVSIDRIVKNVREEVAELAKTVGHEQVPAIYDQVLGDFYFKK